MYIVRRRELFVVEQYLLVYAVILHFTLAIFSTFKVKLYWDSSIETEDTC